MRKPKNQTEMVRITSGAVPRLRLMSVRSNRGRRFRTLVAIALSFLLVASGFYGANSLADQHEGRQTWNGNPANGTVEVSLDQGDQKSPSSSISLTLGPGDYKTYYVRLSKQPLTNGWYVLIRARVNGMMLTEWILSARMPYSITQQTSPGCRRPTGRSTWRAARFRVNRLNGKDVRIRAKDNLAEPVTINIKHEVWEDEYVLPDTRSGPGDGERRAYRARRADIERGAERPVENRPFLGCSA